MNFKDTLSCYEAIGETLANAAPAGWSNIEAEIKLSGIQIDAVVSYIEASGSSGNLTGVPMLARYFYELARLVSTEDKGLFKSCTFSLQSSGKYDAKFIY
ncbi:MAG: hypothetical protein JWR16_3391 [Nevskia sp.]|nr:hypothetical protein [Nevskia sp.]